MKRAGEEAVFIPPRLAAAISSIPQKTLSYITAGSGFGKTTAVAKLLERVPREISYHWYTCFEEASESAWAGICRLISRADEKVGEYLSKLELPTPDNLGYIATIMSELSCEKDIILIIDNLQFAHFSAPYGLLNALAAHHCEKLHIVVISQPLHTDEAAELNALRIFVVPQELFCFNSLDIRKLFALSGASISDGEAQRLCLATEGWVAALRLHLNEYLKEGTLSWDMGINELMERSFWKRLGKQQQKLFLGLSLLDTFNQVQAARMLGQDIISDELWESVRDNPFVRKAGREYVLHTLLKAFLTAKFETQSAGIREKLYARAGAACQTQGKNVQALLFYIRANDDLGAVSVPITSVELAELVREMPDTLEAMFSRCRLEFFERRWLLLLGTIEKASLNSKTRLAKTALRRLSELKDLPDCGETQRENISSAMEMAASFRAYNDVKEMRRHHGVAIEMLEDPQDFYVTNDSWTFCIPSVVYMFWRESGELADTIGQLHGGIPNYAVLSGGKGLGSPEIMKAEAALYAGRYDKAVTEAYLARTIAQRAGQDCILFCVFLLLARASILKSDAATFVSNVNQIMDNAFRGKEFLCVIASETALGFLYSQMDMEEKIPTWMLTAETVRENLYPVSVPFALIVTLRHIGKHAPQELIGTAEAYIQEADEHRHLLPKLYFLLEEALWYEKHNQYESALNKTGLAMSLAVSDDVLLPFAEYYAQLSNVICEVAFTLGGEELKQRIRTLGRQFENGAAAVRAALDGVSPLTPREREVALLAQQHYSTKQIAAELSISTATVKNTLSNIYSKLEIGGKAELANRQF